MKLLKDDPRLLQFVLDEISPSDRIVVENAINSQPEISAEVQILKNIYSDVSAAETAPNDLRLSAEHRKELFDQTIDKKSFKFFGLPSSFKYWGYSAGGLIAAAFAFLVFTHSLKNEVNEQVASVHTVIPVDSDPATQIAGASIDSAKPDQISVPEPAKKIAVDDVAKESQTEKLSAKPQALINQPQEELPQAALARNAVVAAPQTESEMDDSEGLKSAFGAGKAKTTGKYKGEDSDLTTHHFEVLISSRALEAEQIKTMTAFVESCLTKNYIGRELKIEFMPQEDKFNITNSNPSGAELNFAKCSQKAFGPPISPNIKVISVEIRSAFSK